MVHPPTPSPSSEDCCQDLWKRQPCGLVVMQPRPVLQNKSDMRHSGKLSRREVLRHQACRSASKVKGGTCPTCGTGPIRMQDTDVSKTESQPVSGFSTRAEYRLLILNNMMALKSAGLHPEEPSRLGRLVAGHSTGMAAGNRPTSAVRLACGSPLPQCGYDKALRFRAVGVAQMCRA